MIMSYKLSRDEYRRLYLENAKILAKYQDEIVPRMREQIERLKKEAERPGCKYCRGRSYTDKPFEVTTQREHKLMVQFHYCPCCGKKLEGAESDHRL